jgi:hypothetical protein
MLESVCPRYDASSGKQLVQQLQVSNNSRVSFVLPMFLSFPFTSIDCRMHRLCLPPYERIRQTFHPFEEATSSRTLYFFSWKDIGEVMRSGKQLQVL